MKSDTDVLTTIAVHFAFMSFLALGGANAVAPEIHRLTVDVHGWITDRQFADMFAIAQAAPGPNVMIVTLIGFHVAGLPGAVVATLAMCGPTAVLALYFARTWERFRDAPWRLIVQAGLVPISIGLIGASAIVLTRAAVHEVSGVAIAATTAVFAYWTRWNPLWLILAAAVAGLSGWV